MQLQESLSLFPLRSSWLLRPGLTLALLCFTSGSYSWPSVPYPSPSSRFSPVVPSWGFSMLRWGAARTRRRRWPRYVCLSADCSFSSAENLVPGGEERRVIDAANIPEGRDQSERAWTQVCLLLGSLGLFMKQEKWLKFLGFSYISGCSVYLTSPACLCERPVPSPLAMEKQFNWI